MLSLTLLLLMVSAILSVDLFKQTNKQRRSRLDCSDVVRLTTFIYLMTIRIQTKPYTICSSHQLRLEHYIFLFSLFYTIKAQYGKLAVFMHFFEPPCIQNQQEPHTICLSEPTVLFMKFPTCDREASKTAESHSLITRGP